MSVAVFIPSYKRPKQLFSVIAQLHAVSPSVEVYPVVEAWDTDSHIGNYIINEFSPSYAGCINTAYKKTKEEYFFMGADDLYFHPGWLEEVMKVAFEGVIGTNDLHNPDVLAKTHSTHSLVSRKYIQTYDGTIDHSFPVLYEYKHNYCDTEFILTARKRGKFVMSDAQVEHLHWAWGLSQKDETYMKGFNADREDRATFEQRSHLWS